MKGEWPLAGVVAGGSGLAVSWFASQALNVRAWPVVAVAEQVIQHTPGGVARWGIKQLGHHDKPVLVTIILALLTLIFALIGTFGRRLWVAFAGFFLLAAIGGWAVGAEHAEGGGGQVAVVLGLLAWVAAYALITEPLRLGGTTPSESRRTALRAGVVAATAGVVALIAPRLGRGRREVEAARSALSLPGVTKPVVPAGADLGLAQPWQTPVSDFYRVDTTVTPPAVDPSSWKLRIHGLVETPVTITFADLLARQRTQAWITLNCVSNPVGGDLIGNAWWSGVLVSTLLKEAGVKAGADAVLQTSADGWTCGTPLAAMTDDRNALLAVAMNGAPLPINHGFPVRTIVPGLYGYVSACKWVVDLEVTTMDKAVGYWIPLGWAVKGPVKLASRIDRPGDSQVVKAGDYALAGVAWEQDTGIAKVEVSVDGGAWTQAELGTVPDADTWVQWRAVVPLKAGSHSAQVRATSKAGVVQTGVQRGEAPDGATGWHRIDFEAS